MKTSGISIGFYKKHFALWSLIGLAALFATSDFSMLGGPKISADEIPTGLVQVSTGVYSMNVDIAQNGRVQVNKSRVKKAIVPLKDTDQLRLVLIDKPAEPVYSTQIRVTLPPKANAKTLPVTARLVHNFEVNVQKQIIDSRTLLLKTDYIDPSATLSLEIDFPKGVLSLPVGTILLGNLFSNSLAWWIAAATSIPLVTLIVFMLVIQRRLSIVGKNRSNRQLAQPPSTLPPAVVEALISGRLTSRSITATLVDLAQRGYLIIGSHGSDFRFGKHKAFKLPSQQVFQADAEEADVDSILKSISQIKDTTDLRLYERLILSKIFTAENRVTNRQDLELRIGHRLFSEKIAKVYAEIYDLATLQGYFVENPAEYHKHYKNIGLGLFAASLVGFGIGMAFFPEPKTALLVWVGMMVASLAIIKISPRLPILNPKGIAAYQQWYSFRNYLTDPSGLKFSSDTARQFSQYLPYAIIFGVEKEWSARFRDFPFSQPEWFTADETVANVGTFDTLLFPLVNWVGQNLSLARTPVVD